VAWKREGWVRSKSSTAPAFQDDGCEVACPGGTPFYVQGLKERVTRRKAQAGAAGRIQGSLPKVTVWPPSENQPTRNQRKRERKKTMSITDSASAAKRKDGVCARSREALQRIAPKGKARTGEERRGKTEGPPRRKSGENSSRSKHLSRADPHRQ